MFIQRIHKKTATKIYTSTVLMESYREGKKVKHRTLANLSKLPESVIDQFSMLLKGKAITALSDLKFSSGKAIGGIYAISEVAKRLGIAKALGNGGQGRLAMVQVAGRVLTQGSKLHVATEWKKGQAVGSVFKVDDNFDEGSLYENLDWLCDNQESIEQKIFAHRKKADTQTKEIFLYDVTSSYLEGDKNELAEYGYNRDKKKGKKQIVVGLLCDDQGYPLSVEVFKGNTNDLSTVSSQLKKLKENFGVERVVFVGDGGMIKKQQIDELASDTFKWNYVTSISKSQINSLLRKDIFQMELFDDDLTEIQDGQIRYILRRNPTRQEEMKENREQRIARVKAFVDNRNQYLSGHPKASGEVALKNINELVGRLKLSKIISCGITGRAVTMETDTDALVEQCKLDGCYAIKTDLKKDELDKETVHARYKDLSKVEFAFRTLKTTIEEIRPIYVRKEKRTRGHVFVCMLAYMVIKYVADALEKLDYTRKDIFDTLDRIQYINYKFNSEDIKIMPTELMDSQQKILDALNIKLPRYA